MYSSQSACLAKTFNVSDHLACNYLIRLLYPFANTFFASLFFFIISFKLFFFFVQEGENSWETYLKIAFRKKQTNL